MVSLDKNISGNNIIYSPKIDCSVDEYKDQITVGRMEYGNELYQRYLVLEKLCQEYSGTIVGRNYEAEKTRLQNEMAKYVYPAIFTKEPDGKYSNLHDFQGKAATGKVN